MIALSDTVEKFHSTQRCWTFFFWRMDWISDWLAFDISICMTFYYRERAREFQICTFLAHSDFSDEWVWVIHFSIELIAIWCVSSIQHFKCLNNDIICQKISRLANCNFILCLESRVSRLVIQKKPTSMSPNSTHCPHAVVHTVLCAVN